MELCRENKSWRAVATIGGLCWCLASASYGLEGWLETTRLIGTSKGHVAKWESSSDLTFESPLEPPAVVCLGSDETALACQSVATPLQSLDLPPRWGVVLTGLVEGEPGSPVPEIWLHLEGLAGRRTYEVPLQIDESSHELMRRVEITKDRRFELPPLAPGSFRLITSWPGGAIRASEPIQIPPAEKLVPRAEEIVEHPRLEAPMLEVPEGLEMTAWAIDDRGFPVPKSKVFLSFGSFEDRVSMQGRTNVDGEFTFLGVDPGSRRAELRCRAPGHWETVEDIDPRLPMVPCELPRLATVTGLVEDDIGEPISGVRVVGAGTQSETDTDGSFVLEDLKPGKSHLVFSAPGYRIRHVEVTAPPGEKTALEATRLEVAEAWKVVVVEKSADAERGTEAYQPVAGAVIRVHSTGEEATTDLDGKAEVFGEAGGWLAVEGDSEHSRASVSLPEAPGERPLKVALEGTGDARVSVVANGEPCVDCVVGIHCPNHSQEGRTDASGSVEFQGLPARRCYAGRTFESVNPWNVSSWSGGDRVSAEIVAGETAEIVLDDVRDLVEIDLPGLPAGWTVSGRQASHSHSVARWKDGVFHLPIQEHDALEVFVGRGTTSLKVLSVERPRRNDRLTVQLPTAALTMTSVCAHAVLGEVFRQGERIATLILNPQKRHTLPYLEPGNYTVVLGGRSAAQFQLSAGEVHDLGLVGGTSTGLQIGR